MDNPTQCRTLKRAKIAPEAKPPPPMVPLAAAVSSGHVGQYVHSEMELVAGLWLKADSTFEYGLTMGSLDGMAKVRWTASGDHIALVNVPPPVPPTMTAGAAVRDATVGLRVKIITTSSRGILGVDLFIGFDRGDPIGDYTQSIGWTLSADAAARAALDHAGDAVVWLEFAAVLDRCGKSEQLDLSSDAERHRRGRSVKSESCRRPRRADRHAAGPVDAIRKARMTKVSCRAAAE